MEVARPARSPTIAADLHVPEQCLAENARRTHVCNELIQITRHRNWDGP
jgi:hypothetical protein